MAPDKIYVNFPFGEKYPWRGPMVTKQGLNRNDTTYIRKDALLALLKTKLSHLQEDFDVYTGQRIILRELINEIESL